MYKCGFAGPIFLSFHLIFFDFLSFYISNFPFFFQGKVTSLSFQLGDCLARLERAVRVKKGEKGERGEKRVKGEMGEVDELRERLKVAGELVGEVEGIVREVKEMGGRLSEMEQVSYYCFAFAFCILYFVFCILNLHIIFAFIVSVFPTLTFKKKIALAQSKRLLSENNTLLQVFNLFTLKNLTKNIFSPLPSFPSCSIFRNSKPNEPKTTSCENLRRNSKQHSKRLHKNPTSGKRGVWGWRERKKQLRIC